MNKLAEACAAGVSLIALSGCGQPSVLDANAAETELVDFNGYQGVWLKSETAEAFVAVDPFARLLVFRRVGEANVLSSDRRSLEGIRTWFMEPTQNKFSARPARRPARVSEKSERFVEVVAEPCNRSNLRTGMQVRLSEDRPELTIRHFMENLSDRTRQIAVWSIAAFPRTGRAIIPFGFVTPDEAAFRTVVLFDITRVDDPGLTFGKRALQVDFGGPRDDATKIGVQTDAGWAAWTDGEDVLTMKIDYDPSVRYPEGGSNVTSFVAGGDPAESWAELEHVGPLQTVAPGQRAWLDDRLQLHTLTPSADLGNPSAARESIESASRKNAVP